MELLTEAQAATLLEAHDLLKALANPRPLTPLLDELAGDTHEALYVGRTLAAADQAHDAIFGFLSAASSFLDDPIAELAVARAINGPAVAAPAAS